MMLLLSRVAVLTASAGVARALYTQRQSYKSTQDPNFVADDPNFDGDYFPLYPPPSIPPSHPASPAHDAPRPNILYIIADDLGWGDVGYHNNEAVTPNIDALAGEGVRLERLYSERICAPARASIMTGRYPHRFGFQHLGHALSSGSVAAVPLTEKLLPEHLKEAGYTTHLVGKWDLGVTTRKHLPQFRGFDTHFGHYGTDLYYKEHKDHRGNVDLHFGVRGRDAQCLRDLARFDDLMLFTKKALQIISYHRPRNGPLFLCLAYHSVGGPNYATEEFDMYPKTTPVARRTKLAMVTAMDKGVGEVVERWRTAHGEAFWNNSVVIFQSDNGGSTGGKTGGMNFPLRGGRYTLFEGGVRVNAFVLSPLIERPGRIENGLMHVTDMLPVLVDRLSGVPLAPGKQLDGMDVWDTISRGDPSPRTEIVHGIDYLGNAEMGTHGPIIRGCGASGALMGEGGRCELSGALRQGRWKLIAGMYARCPARGSKRDTTQCGYRVYNTTPFWAGISADTAPGKAEGGTSMASNELDGLALPVALFDIEVDPFETTDLSSEHSDIANGMLQRLTENRKGEWMDPQYPPYHHCETPKGSCEMHYWQYASAVNRKGCVDYLFRSDLAPNATVVPSYPEDWRYVSHPDLD